jgi:hypothetical protein
LASSRLLVYLEDYATMTRLSPAAQAVLDAVASQMEGGWISPGFILYHSKKIAAALRAAADQVVPENAEAVGDKHDDARADQWMRIRYKLLAIAAELEANQ